MDHTPSAIRHALDTIEAFQFGPKEFSARELHEMLHIPRATQYRVLRVLEERGYLRRDPQSGRYRMGFKILQLAALAQDQMELVRIAQDVLHRMWIESRETAQLAVVDGLETVYLRVLESPVPHRFVLRPGVRAPIHCTSPGLAILAHSPKEKVEEVLRAGLKRFTDKTITAPEALLARLEQIRREGVAINRGEWRESGGGISAPAFDFTGEAVAAIGLSGPNDRLTEDRVPAIAEAVRRGAAELSRLLGGAPSPPLGAESGVSVNGGTRGHPKEKSNGVQKRVRSQGVL
ncbi:MAG: IclR family transcriptional regulator [Candidatus Tectomicrobia bacterium]|uniref:IclR family transcriptional regulator n=1 Tax=Tectimicrobiota bacterium TaxID=2528274 RepID=A0A932HWL8_UNCTE|nr:IclR family transcriptional regulator [Candidatus Tectomicrobia bacterium]